MKPITFKFLERPNESGVDYSIIEYDNELNLCVDKRTNLPAIDSINMETETFTKTQGEVSDSDADIRMDTMTRTLTQMESSDSDFDIQSSIIESELIEESF